MSYVVVNSGAIVGAEMWSLPPAARRLDTGAWVTPAGGVWSAPEMAACGLVHVVAVARPADTATTTTDRSVTLLAGVPTEVWTSRPKTQAEVDAATAATNDLDLRSKAATALTNNTAYLGIGSPTNAQAVAQVSALTRQVNALIRLAIRALSDTSGT